MSAGNPASVKDALVTEHLSTAELLGPTEMGTAKAGATLGMAIQKLRNYFLEALYYRKQNRFILLPFPCKLKKEKFKSELL